MGPELIRDMEEQVIHIRQWLKEAQYMQKIYANADRVDRNYKVGDAIFI